MSSRAVAIIPARFASTRFPGKPLADRTGKPLVQHVYEQVTRCELIERIIVATDDQRILDAVERFGGEAVMTRPDHPNGTSRLSEVAEDVLSDLLVNVQGDEPEIDPELIDLAVRTADTRPSSPMTTLAAPFEPFDDPADPNIVKVVLDREGHALYFSRSLIPYGGGVRRAAPRNRHARAV
jgi:3-deoxy-manno-octulosonate cytidylyltransferase (CMP-KDO synthetase)